MKNIVSLNSYLDKVLWVVLFFTFSIVSCRKGLLDEKPLSELSPDNTLTNVAGFQEYLNGLYWAAREQYTTPEDGKFMTLYLTYWDGTDEADDAGAENVTYRNWATYLVPQNPEVGYNWNWAYKQIISQANTVIEYANKPEMINVWTNDAQKNSIIAVAKFFRGYAYDFLADLYGGVPIVDSLSSTPRFDYVRSSRQDVYTFAMHDLQFAAQWLPMVADADGKATSAAANHLLTEVYINLGQYDSAIASASRVINSGAYHLMTSRFGSQAGSPGDVFSDLFRDGNQNRASGNMESIFVLQFDQTAIGGGGSTNGNNEIRTFAPFLVHIKAPDGIPMIVTDSLGRGTGRIRPSNYSEYTIWDGDWGDMRNSQYNWRRVFYYNNPTSASFGQIVGTRTAQEDTMRSLYAYTRKVEGAPWQGVNTSGRTAKDITIYRLAETYLFRAEAYLMKNDLQDAANDINTLRSRANAPLIQPSQVTIDFILDERARELWGEENRRATLSRLGKLVERVRKYALLDGSRNTVQDFNNLWPIPQPVIDANFGAKLEQNPGY